MSIQLNAQIPAPIFSPLNNFDSSELDKLPDFGEKPTYTARIIGGSIGVTTGVTATVIAGILFPPLGLVELGLAGGGALIGTTTLGILGWQAGKLFEKTVLYLLDDLTKNKWFRDRNPTFFGWLNNVNALRNASDIKEEFIKFAQKTPEMRQFITAVTITAIGVPFCLSANTADIDGVKYDKATVEAHLKKYIEKKT